MGRLLFETDGSGNTVAAYVCAIARVSAVKENNASYHSDKTGNAVALTDGSGAIAQAYAYGHSGPRDE